MIRSNSFSIHPIKGFKAVKDPDVSAHICIVGFVLVVPHRLDCPFKAVLCQVEDVRVLKNHACV
jgi:hypothetical protein